MTKRWMTALLAGALVLASCGGSKGESSVELVQGAGAAVLDQKTAHIELRFEGFGQDFTMNGQLDFAQSAGSYDMDIPVVGQVELIQDGTDLYVRTGGASGWTLITMEGDLADQAVSGFGADPRAILEQLADAGSIREVGKEDVRGVATTHYIGALDIEKALAAQGTPEDQIDAIMKEAGAVETSIEVYIDDDGLAHRTVSVTKIGAIGDITVTMDMLDFGEPVSITVPDASEVVRTESVSTQFDLNQLTQQIMIGG